MIHAGVETRRRLESVPICPVKWPTLLSEDCKEVRVLVHKSYDEKHVVVLDDHRYVRANAGCKHFDVHGGPEDVPVSRFSFDSKVRRLKSGNFFYKIVYLTGF